MVIMSASSQEGLLFTMNVQSIHPSQKKSSCLTHVYIAIQGFADDLESSKLDKREESYLPFHLTILLPALFLP